MADQDDSPEQLPGIGIDDLPDLMREMFRQCVDDARARRDPAEDCDAFIEALWQQVDAAYGITRRDWPDQAPQPWPALVDEQRGVAEAVLEGRLRPGELPT